MIQLIRVVIKILVFWILCFDLHRLAFSIHHYGKLHDVGFGEWLLGFVFSFRLDLATASALSIIPFLFLWANFFSAKKIFTHLFRISMVVLMLILSLVEAGEIVAYGEWNHKLTSRVFMHLAHPDEVARTANYGMIGWYVFYAVVLFTAQFFLFRFLFKNKPQVFHFQKTWVKVPVYFVSYSFVGTLFFILLRGGLQPIPLNINAATYTNKAIANDISINPLYFFGKSYLLYNRSEIDAFIPKVDLAKAEKAIDSWYSYPKKHNNYILKNQRPNVIFIILESWSANAIGVYGNNKGATPHFDKLTKEGLLFTNVFATGTTSEIGNSSIFSGYYSLPEVSISMQPEKHRKLHCLNEDFEAWGYHSSYMFSGDLKYGNIGGYFMDHGFDVVKDEADFPSDLPRGKLNFYDKDLYRFLIDEINANKKPFFQCAFTGSTHAPYDQPIGKGKVFTGEEADFMNSMVYADQCLGEFIENCKKQAWYKNTLFVFVADHGHAAPGCINPGFGSFYHVPLLFYGEPLQDAVRGTKNNVLGSQADIAATLLYQLGGDVSRYPYSKDLLNPKVPQFAFHSIIRGYGWMSQKGNFTYYMEQKIEGENTYKPSDFKREKLNCAYFLNVLYRDYKKM
ncbi:MAG TPA: sulfatase-like hydrolase/transferase [Fluviicola sp.]|nr:sulfatase-like hydrolase/transferase [Fluviicola sp.]